MRRHTFNINLCRWEKKSRKRGRFPPSGIELDGNGKTSSDEVKNKKQNNVGLCVNACVWP